MRKPWRARPRWNALRKQRKAAAFLRLAGVSSVEEASAKLADPNVALHYRCLSARAVGLLGDEDHWKMLLAADPGDDSPLGRACGRALTDIQSCRRAKFDIKFLEEARQKMQGFGWTEASQAIAVLAGRRNSLDLRKAAASALGGLRHRPATSALVAALPDGDWHLAWAVLRH